MKCKDIENRLIDYIDGNVDANEAKSIEAHLETCQNCSHEYAELMTVLTAMEEISPSLPDEQFRTIFLEAIQREAVQMEVKKSRRGTFFIARKTKNRILSVAATIALMCASYYFGNRNAEHNNQTELAQLQTEQDKLKTEVTLSLIENTSASKRLQAITYAEALEAPDITLLQAIISKMKNDTYVSVRLAAAQALSKFYHIEEVREALLVALQHEEDPSMQIELIQILVDIQEKRAIPKIKNLLEDHRTPSHLKEQIRTELKQLI